MISSDKSDRKEEILSPGKYSSSSKIGMRLIKVLMLIVFCLILPDNAFCQSTRVKGKVIDSETGEGIPFVGIYFKDTFIGVSTDMSGNYILESREKELKSLKAEILGYEAQQADIKEGAFNEVNFSLKPIHTTLDGVTIKADDRKVRRLMALVDKFRDQNNPQKKSSYQCDTYTKMEFDLIDAQTYLDFKALKKNFGFVFDYVDTSVVNGLPYLPAMITETLAKSYHSLSPNIDREEIIANRVSGVNNESIAQFTGSMHVKTNLYQNFLDIFEVQIPSPLSSSGFTYYNYFLIDSLAINGRKTYKVRFHPKYVSTPVFDGEFNIDAEDYALEEAHIRLAEDVNVNWIKNLVIDIQNQRTDSVWFYKQDRLFAEFSPDKKDTSKILTFFGTRQIDYSNPVFNQPIKKSITSASNNVLIARNVQINDERFWQEVRPSPLSEKEMGIYKMVDEVKAVPAYNTLYNIANALTEGYYNIRNWSWGPYHKFFSFNNLEGARFQVGGRTSHDFSHRRRYSAYVAYGTKDKDLKGSVTGEFMLGNNSMAFRKLTLNARKDIVQLGKSDDAFVEANIMSSIMNKGNSGKMSPITEFSAAYEHEWNQIIDNTVSLVHRKIFSNSFVPMVTPDGRVLKSISSNQININTRLSWNEMVTRGYFKRQYMFSDYPIIYINLLGSIKGLGENSFSYFRPELVLSYRLPIPPLGLSKVTINAGKIFGQVPYPLLKVHEGNGSYYLDASAFACMDYYEFASDTWITMFYRHDFKGFFLGKIPLLRRLDWRENIFAKVAYGTISEKNDGNLSLGASAKAPLLFPEGMSSLGTPYVELGAGISNIFRLFRIDYYQRITHKREAKKNHAINFGIEFSF